MGDSTRHLGATDGSVTDWAAFVARLESRIAAIGPRGSLAIDLSNAEDDWAPYVQIARSPNGDELFPELTAMSS